MVARREGQRCDAGVLGNRALSLVFGRDARHFGGCNSRALQAKKKEKKKKNSGSSFQSRTYSNRFAGCANDVIRCLCSTGRATRQAVVLGILSTLPAIISNCDNVALNGNCFLPSIPVGGITMVMAPTIGAPSLQHAVASMPLAPMLRVFSSRGQGSVIIIKQRIFSRALN